MAYIKEYQINTSGASKGLTIPSGFRIGITRTNIYQKGSDFELELEVCTYKSSGDTTLLTNDAIDINEKYPLLASGLTTSLETLVDDNLRPDLNTAYGSGNVVEIS